MLKYFGYTGLKYTKLISLSKCDSLKIQNETMVYIIFLLGSAVVECGSEV